MLLEIPITGEGETPTKAHESDAAFDLRAHLTPENGWPLGKCFLRVRDTCSLPTGISIALPEGYAALVLPRSGLAALHGITVLNAPGLIDSGYRGEIRALLAHHGRHDFTIEHGDRIAQLLIIRPERALFHVLPERLFDTNTDRGEAGIGSTGVR